MINRVIQNIKLSIWTNHNNNWRGIVRTSF